jgi:hypothetical protein
MTTNTTNNTTSNTTVSIDLSNPVSFLVVAELVKMSGYNREDLLANTRLNELVVEVSNDKMASRSATYLMANLVWVRYTKEQEALKEAEALRGREIAEYWAEQISNLN